MRYFMKFSYNGSKYNGYQIQKDKVTVQGVLEELLSKIFNEKIRISASGRTDALVHAYGQCAHFDSNKVFDFEKLKYALNSMFDYIYIKEISEVPEDFHARYSVLNKEYVYKINVGEYNPIEKDLVYQLNRKLDLDSMKNAIKLFEGEHDFTSFTSLDFEKDCTRTIYETYINEKNDLIEIGFVGNGFLKYMVRNMVGLLIEIGLGKREIESVTEILEYKDRKQAGVCANPEGLYLKQVNYELHK